MLQPHADRPLAQRRRGRAVVLAGILAGSLLLAGATALAPQGNGEPHPAPGDAGETVFEWSVPPGTTGDLVVRFVVTMEAFAVCQFETRAGGVTGAMPAVLFWGDSPFGAFFVSRPGLVHLGDSFPVWESLEVEGLAWQAGVGWQMPLPVTSVFTFAVTGLEGAPGRPGGDGGFSVRLECGAPIHIDGFAGSRDFVTLREHSLDGIAILETVVVHDGAETAVVFTNQLVHAQLYVSQTWYQAGMVTFEHPEGETQHRLDAGGFWLDHNGPGGTYGVSVTRTAVGPLTTYLVGVMAGLDPVDALGDLA